MRRPNLGVIFLSVFGGIGLVFLIVGVVFFVSQTRFKEAAVMTTATIVDIFRWDRSSDVIVSFEAGGKTYEGELGYYSSGMRVGGSISVWYNPDDPYDFRPDSMLLPLIFGLIGIIFLPTGVALFFSMGAAAGRRKRLMETGYRINAQIVRVDFELNFRVNGRSPWRVLCEGYDAESGGSRLFKSGYLWMDPNPVLYEKQIQTLPVYLESRKRKRYYVDISVLEANHGRDYMYGRQ